MGLKKNDNKPRTGTQKPEFKFNLSAVTNALRNDTFLFVSGAVITIIAIFFIIAYISFLFNGGTDQSAIANGVAQEIENSTGLLGARVSDNFVNRWFGIPSILIPIFLTVCGLNMMRITHFRVFRWFVSCTFLMVWCSSFLQLVLSSVMSNSFIVPGGSHGVNLNGFFVTYVGVPGLILIQIVTMLIYCVYLTRRTIQVIREGAEGIKRGVRHMERTDETGTDDVQADDIQSPADDDYTFSPEPFEPEPESVPEPEPVKDLIQEDIDDEIPEGRPRKAADAPAADAPKDESAIEMTISTGAQEQKAQGNIQEPYDPRLDLSHYKFPTLDLLKHYDNDAPAIDKNEQEANKQRIIKVLQDFGIEIDTINATVGPTITLYEITPAAGVRISKIRNLEADIALSLAALGIRIIAPIPGKGTIGIEVPNAKPVMVSMESILNSRKFAESKMELPVALGRTITNEVFMFDLAKMPHLLVAGATSQGKSVGLNAVTTSLLYKKPPAVL